VNEAVEDADHLATQSNAIPRAASILVNCAGITRDGKIDNISDADWNDVLDINLKGTFHMCQSFCRTKRLASLLSDGNENEATGTATGGSIINIGSIVAQYGNVGQVNYASSKGGVVGLTRSLAKEMALFSHKFVQNKGIGAGDTRNDSVPPSIRVNCIQPGTSLVEFLSNLQCSSYCLFECCLSNDTFLPQLFSR
jgi:NAD(P)-dependent dehydrogenase (short-subunit alcohol dehydrogenase family)